MKRVFAPLLTLLLCLGTAQAQVRITCDGREIQDGDTLTFYAYEVADEFGMYDAPEAGPSHDPLFTNTTEAPLSQFAVSVTTSANCADRGIYWCGLTTRCEDVKGGAETREVTLPANGVKAMDMHGRFTLYDYQTYTVDVTVSIGGERYMSFCEVFVYDKAHASGIAPVKGDAQVRYADGVLYYDYASAALRTITVLAPDGRCCLRHTTAKRNGSISLDRLTRGTYIYIIEENGRRIASGKCFAE